MALYRSPDYQINWRFGSGKEVQNNFQDNSHGGHLGFLIGTLALFIYIVTLMLPTKFGVNWPLGSEEAKNRFSRWYNVAMAAILDF